VIPPYCPVRAHETVPMNVYVVITVDDTVIVAVTSKFQHVVSDGIGGATIFAHARLEGAIPVWIYVSMKLYLNLLNRQH
jgi:hypothetical protein